MDPDAGPDPAIFVIDLQDANKKLSFKTFFLLITFWRYVYIMFKNKKSQKSDKTVGIKVFLTTFAWCQEDPDPYWYLWLVDPDPGGPKKYRYCGSDI